MLEIMVTKYHRSAFYWNYWSDKNPHFNNDDCKNTKEKRMKSKTYKEKDTRLT